MKTDAKSIFRHLVAKQTTVMWRIAESRKQASTQYIAVGARRECVEEEDDEKEKAPYLVRLWFVLNELLQVEIGEGCPDAVDRLQSDGRFIFIGF